MKRIALVMITLVLLSTSHAFAQDKVACAAAYEKVQIDRRDGHLRAAHENAALCSRASCPAVLQRDCLVWLRELEATLPSVVIEATGPNGRETLDVRVTCDGALLAERLDGRAMSIDPGPHTCRFETAGATMTDSIVLHEGDQHRRWRVAFPVSAPPPPSRPEPAPHRQRVPIAAYVLGGLGLAAVGAGTYFEIHGWNGKSELDACRPDCTRDLLDRTRADFIIGDIAIGVGVVAIGAALWFAFLRSDRDAARTSYEVRF